MPYLFSHLKADSEECFPRNGRAIYVLGNNIYSNRGC